MTKKPNSRLISYLAILGLLVTIFGLSSSLVRLIGRKSLLTAKQEELAKIQKEKSELEQKLLLAQTPEFVEKEARIRLNLAKPGETIILVENVPTTEQYTISNDGQNIPNWKKWWQLFF